MLGVPAAPPPGRVIARQGDLAKGHVVQDVVPLPCQVLGPQTGRAGHLLHIKDDTLGAASLQRSPFVAGGQVWCMTLGIPTVTFRG